MEIYRIYYRTVHCPQGPVNNILCTGEILTRRTGASIGYIQYNLGEGGLGFLTLWRRAFPRHCKSYGGFAPNDGLILPLNQGPRLKNDIV
jgi:hypothetical protein